MGFPLFSLKGLISGLSPAFGVAGGSICTPIFILSWICFVWSMVLEISYNGGSNKGYKLELPGVGESSISSSVARHGATMESLSGVSD